MARTPDDTTNPSSRDAIATEKNKVEQYKTALVQCLTKKKLEEEAQFVSTGQWKYDPDLHHYRVGDDWAINVNTNKFTWVQLRDAQGRRVLLYRGVFKTDSSGVPIAEFTGEEHAKFE